ncbi:MAG: methionyl-tRNA formyltransferase [Acidobacteriaceae bacterium]
MKVRLVFMGSPDFALPVLQQLIESYPVVGIVTQPDRPAGRGRLLTPPPVKVKAQQLGIQYIQPRRLSEPDAIQQISHWAPDLIVVAAFGQILRPAVLDLPKFGCINVHASLLPLWRGAAPIQAAILNGDAQTGISIMQMDPGVDTGPLLSQSALEISQDDTAGTLSEKLSHLGADLLIITLSAYLDGSLKPQPQNESLATYAPMIKKEDGLLDFEQPAEDLERQIRAFNPKPGAYTLWKGQILKIHRGHAVDQLIEPVGKRIIHQGLPAFTTGRGLLVADELQPAGKHVLTGKAFLQGARNWEG